MIFLKVNTKILVEFLQKATINGIIEDMLLDFKPEGLSVTMRDSSNLVAVNAFLHRDGAFMDYQEGQIPILSSSRLINLLKTVDGIAEIFFEKNMFRVVGDDVDFNIIVGRKEYLVCKSLDKWPTLEYSGKFNLDTKIFDLANKAYSELKSNCSVRDIVLSLDNGVIKVQVGSGLSDTVVPKALIDANWTANGSFDISLLEAMKGIKGTVKVNFDNELPLMIEQKSDLYNIVIMFAPMSEEED